MYGRQPRAPLTRLLRSVAQIAPFGNRLDDLAEALHSARENTAESRQYNRARLAKKANANLLEVGDQVVIKAPEPRPFTSHWDPQWTVTRVSGSTVHIRNQTTGESKKLHREKVKLVDTQLVWDGIPRRPRRQRANPVIANAPAENPPR